MSGFPADYFLRRMGVYVPDCGSDAGMLVDQWLSHSGSGRPCITHDIDLAQINLACPQPSQLVAWKILDVRAAGTTCIAPVGDTATQAAFPAALPTLIAVGSLAHTGTHPDAPHPAPGMWPGPYCPPTPPPART